MELNAKFLCSFQKKELKMNELVGKIIASELQEQVTAISKIEGLGLVNQVFDVQCNHHNYIVRINTETGKALEFTKEAWCLQKVATLSVASPKVLANGTKENLPFMIQSKINGINGSLCTAEEQVLIWKSLGKLASIFHQIKRIEVAEVEKNEFHKNWRSKLEYNIEQLQEDDSLIKDKAFTVEEHQMMKNILKRLRSMEFEEGLIHGDLSPRNTIFNKNKTTLLDWGTAEINIVPHTEIGITLIEKKLTREEFNAFLEGLGIGVDGFQNIENEIRMLNLLHRLDKYRWAYEYDIENIERYIYKIRNCYISIMSR